MKTSLCYCNHLHHLCVHCNSYKSLIITQPWFSCFQTPFCWCSRCYCADATVSVSRVGTMRKGIFDPFFFFYNFVQKALFLDFFLSNWYFCFPFFEPLPKECKDTGSFLISNMGNDAPLWVYWSSFDLHEY